MSAFTKISVLWHTLWLNLFHKRNLLLRQWRIKIWKYWMLLYFLFKIQHFFTKLHNISQVMWNKDMQLDLISAKPDISGMESCTQPSCNCLSYDHIQKCNSTSIKDELCELYLKLFQFISHSSWLLLHLHFIFRKPKAGSSTSCVRRCKKCVPRLKPNLEASLLPL